MPIKLGITGGIGSGKTVVSHLFEIMGVPVYNSDIESKRITANDPYIRKELIALLGEEVYINNELNKPLLANYLFSNPSHTQQINNIIHPRVKIDFHQWIKQHANYSAVAIESAILLESGFSNEVDHIIMVEAPLELRINRSMVRDHSSREAIIQRIHTQMNDEERKALSHHIILNDEVHPLIPQVETLLKTICPHLIP